MKKVNLALNIYSFALGVSALLSYINLKKKQPECDYICLFSLFSHVAVLMPGAGAISMFLLKVIINIKPRLQKHAPLIISMIIMYLLVEKRMGDSPKEFFRTKEG